MKNRTTPSRANELPDCGDIRPGWKDVESAEIRVSTPREMPKACSRRPVTPTSPTKMAKTRLTIRDLADRCGIESARLVALASRARAVLTLVNVKPEGNLTPSPERIHAARVVTAISKT